MYADAKGEVRLRRVREGKSVSGMLVEEDKICLQGDEMLRMIRERSKKGSSIHIFRCPLEMELA